MKFWRWFLLAGVLLAAPAFAESWPPDSVRYVRADADGGNSGRGNSADSAWTLAEACAQATAGYTVLIAPGNYTSTALNPTNSGHNRDTNPPWPGSHGRIRFVGNISNAQACSVSSITVNRPFVTVMGVSTKVGGSVTLGSGSGVGTSQAEYDSLYKIYQKRTSSAFSVRGAQFSSVSSCSLFNRPGAAAGRALVVSHDYPTDIACQRLLAVQGTRVSQFDTLALNYVHVEENRPAERRITISDNTNNCLFSGNTFVGKWSGATISTVGMSDYIYFMWVVNADYNRFQYNRYIFDVGATPPGSSLWFALRDSSSFNTFYGDTAYCGIDYNGLGGGYVNTHSLTWGIGQNANPCDKPQFTNDMCIDNRCSNDSKPHDNTIRRGKYIFNRNGFLANNYTRKLTVDSTVIVSFNGYAVDWGNTEVTGTKFLNNTIVSFGGYPAFVRLDVATVESGSFVGNILVSDSLDTNAGGDPCGTSDLGGVVSVQNPANGAFNRNLYWSRKTQFATHRSAVKDSVIKWAWNGFYAADSGGTSCNGGPWRPNNDALSKFGHPWFSDSTKNKGFNAKPIRADLIMSVTGTGYVGALAPADTTKPGVPSYWAASCDADFVKTFNWTQPGDDSLFFGAESVFVCERADDADSSRIDNTNYQSFIMVGFGGGTPGAYRELVLDPASPSTFNLDLIDYDIPAIYGSLWSGVGSDVVYPGNHISYVRLVVKDDDGNLSFSGTLALTYP